MNFVNKIKEGFRDFKRGLSVIFGKPKPGKGNRKLAQMSKVVMAQIPGYGKDAVRTQIIKSIETDLKRYVRRGGKARVDKALQEAVDTPEYMLLLHKVGLDEPHLRVMAMEAVKKWGSK